MAFPPSTIDRCVYHTGGLCALVRGEERIFAENRLATITTVKIFGVRNHQKNQDVVPSTKNTGRQSPAIIIRGLSEFGMTGYMDLH